jgi:hypothetical protein
VSNLLERTRNEAVMAQLKVIFQPVGTEECHGSFQISDRHMRPESHPLNEIWWLVEGKCYDLQIYASSATTIE